MNTHAFHVHVGNVQLKHMVSMDTGPPPLMLLGLVSSPLVQFEAILVSCCVIVARLYKVHCRHTPTEDCNLFFVIQKSE